jgi:glutamyl-Q tRNA(Asp) synthetase
MSVTRFAPSPTGLLHLGHAFSALTAFAAARAEGGRFLLRIENIDATRCRPAFEEAIHDDLAWLGLSWETPVRRQSEHFADYAAALTRLDAMGLTYPCFCTRKDIANEITMSASAPQGPDGPLYPGTCRHRSTGERAERMASGVPYAVRLNMTRAAAMADALTMIEKRARIAADPSIFGDIVLARKDTPASYHLAVTVDDALQGVTLVTRGEDLFPSSFVHRLLQKLLGLPEPHYHHHALHLGPDGKRLAKRDGARSLKDVKASGVSAADIRRDLGFAALI